MSGYASVTVKLAAAPKGFTVTIDDTAGFGYSGADVYQSDTASYNSTMEKIGNCPVGESITVTVTKPYLFVETAGNSVPDSVSGGISFNSSTGIKSSSSRFWPPLPVTIKTTGTVPLLYSS